MNKTEDWLYKPECEDNCREYYGDKYEVDGNKQEIRYILGERFNNGNEKVLICIGINPSIAIPKNLDPTLKRVQGYAKENGYEAWYMLNIYPQNGPS